MPWPSFQTELKDDRGRSVDCTGSAADTDDPAWREVCERAAALQKMDLSRANLKPWQTAAVAGLAIGLVGAMALRGIYPGWPDWVYLLIAGPPFLVGLVALVTIDREGQRESVAREFLDAGFCPGCGYRLRGCAIEPDGCTVCPECSAAWRAERLSKALPSDAQPRDHTEWRWLRDFFKSPPLVGEDARARRVILRDPRLRCLTPELRERLGEDRVTRLQAIVQWIGSPGVALTIIFAFALPLVFLAVFSGWTTRGGTAWGSRPVVVLLALAYLFYSLRHAWRSGIGTLGLKPRKFIRAFLEHGVCPCCCEPIDPARIGPPREAECATCGSHWQLPHQCPSCRYDLTGLAPGPTTKCPECGRPIT